MAKKLITEDQLRAANKAGYSTQQIAGELQKYEKRTGNDAVYSGKLPNGQVVNPAQAEVVGGALAKYKTIEESIANKRTSAQQIAETAGTAQPVAPVAPVAPTTPETPAPVAPVAPTPAVEPVKEAGKAVEGPTVAPPGFEFGTMMDTNTGAPMLVNTAEVKRQKDLASNLSLYSTGKSLYNAVSSGSILPGTQAFSDITAANPQILADYNAIKTQAENKKQVEALGNAIIGADTTPTTTNDALNSLVNFFTKSMDTDIGEEYTNAVTNNANYQAAVAKNNSIAEEQAQNNANIRAIQTDVRKQMDSRTPESLVASSIAREAKPLIEKGMLLAEQQSNAQSEMARIFEENKTMFDLRQQERTDNRNIALSLYGVINADQIRKEDLQRADEELQMKMESAKSEQEYTMYKDQRDYNLKVAEALQKQENFEIEQGKEASLKASDFLKFEGEKEDGSKYTYYQNPNTGEKLGAQETFGPSGDNVDMKQVLSGFSEYGQQLLSVPDGTVIPTRLGQVSSQNSSIRGKECAEYVNDIAGTKMGNTYQSKLAVCDDDTGGVGSVVAWKPNGSGNYGHTGIIVGQEGDNWLVKSSNYVPGTVTTEKIPKSNIGGYYTPDSVKQANSQEAQPQQAIKYGNGNIRTADGTLIKKEEAYKINKDIVGDKSYEALTASEDMKTAWDTYKSLIDQHGIEMLPGKNKGEMETAYNGVLRAAQKFFALGVFQPYDQKAIEEMIPKYARDFGPFGDTPSRFLNPLFRQQLQGKRKGFEDFIQNKIQNEYTSLNRKYGDFGSTLSAMNDVNEIYKKISDNDLINEY